jgi:phosphohistidine phosphatase
VTVELYIVRHGIAQGPDAEGLSSDTDRALTKEGKARTREVARGLRVIGVRPHTIGTSPCRRAEETARILAKELRPEFPLAVCDFLAPGGAREAGAVGPLVDWLLTLDAEAVMVVGHMPDVADMASGLLHAGGGIDLVFKKAAVCCISFPGVPAEGAGSLEWLLQPGHLRALAGG